MTKPLTSARFDRIAVPPSRKLWGRPAIARFLGVSEDTVAKWAKLPGVPIFEPLPGRYFALRHELDSWLKTKQPPG